ncbi:unnamed protein product, partial [Staurois parvus]
LWSSPVLCPQSLASPVLCPQSLVISCTVSAVSGPSPVLCPQSLVLLLYCVRSLWSFSCTMSAVSGHLLYCVRSVWSLPVLCLQSIGSEYFFSCFSPLKPRRVLWS